MTMEDLTLNISTEPAAEVKKKKTKDKKKKRKAVPEEGSVSFEVEDEHPVMKKKKHYVSSEGNVGEEKKGFYQTGKISSLFGRNPEIPVVEDTDVTPVTEPVFSSETFSEAQDIHPHMVSNLEQNFGITKLTTVQRLSIPVLLSGRDALVKSQTGSGKTLAYAIPIVQRLQEIRPKLTREDGVRAVVILPTRELALQTYECFVKLTRSFTWIVPGMLVGGEKRKSEKARLRRGIIILISTPGRLLDHANHTQSLSLHKVKWFVLDEADKLLDMGYERDISNLVNVLENHRKQYKQQLDLPPVQTLLLSATLTPQVKRLAGLTLNDPEHIDASSAPDPSEEVFVIPQSLTQKYIIVPPKLRLVTLAAFVIQKCEVEEEKKMLIFMATQDMVDFHTELLTTVLPKTAEFLKLHGNMTQAERTLVFKTFRAASAGVLLCTDVAARGLDLPKVEWIVQYTAPPSASDYVHRVGRTARVGIHGSALLFLAPSEMSFYELLVSKRIILKEETVQYCLDSLVTIQFESKDHQKRKGWSSEAAATELQLNFEQAVLDQSNLHKLGCEAYKSWVRFYASYPKEARPIFCFKSLHLGHYAKSFALRDPPTSISGIGKPSFRHEKKSKKPKKEPKMRNRTQELIVSEFDSGLKTSKRVN